MNSHTLNTRRIVIFILIAFVVSWGTAAIIWYTGGLVNSPTIIAGTQYTLAFILLATSYMWGPALANIITRLLTREGGESVLLWPKIKRGWPYWIIAWFLPALLTILGAALFYWIFPVYYDPEATLFMSQISALAGQEMPFSAMTLISIQVFQALLLAPILNAISAFGEEFGWRGYLQPKLMPLGGRKAVMITGIIWGVWHWPVIMMGYNYGFDYSGAPWLGPLAMVWFTLVNGIIFGWLTIKAGSVWPAVIAHGALNGIASVGSLFLAQLPDMILGPTPVGFVASIPMTIIALIILIVPGALQEPKSKSVGPVIDGAAQVPQFSSET